MEPVYETGLPALTSINECEIKIQELKQIMKPNENMCNKLKRVLNSKNRFTIPDQLFNLIKFETTSYISVNKQINPIRKKELVYLNLIMENSTVPLLN